MYINLKVKKNHVENKQDINKSIPLQPFNEVSQM